MRINPKTKFYLEVYAGGLTSLLTNVFLYSISAIGNRRKYALDRGDFTGLFITFVAFCVCHFFIKPNYARMLKQRVADEFRRSASLNTTK